MICNLATQVVSEYGIDENLETRRQASSEKIEVESKIQEMKELFNRSTKACSKKINDSKIAIRNFFMQLKNQMYNFSKKLKNLMSIAILGSSKSQLNNLISKINITKDMIKNMELHLSKFDLMTPSTALNRNEIIDKQKSLIQNLTAIEHQTQKLITTLNPQNTSILLSTQQNIENLSQFLREKSESLQNLQSINESLVRNFEEIQSSLKEEEPSAFDTYSPSVFEAFNQAQDSQEMWTFQKELTDILITKIEQVNLNLRETLILLEKN